MESLKYIPEKYYNDLEGKILENLSFYEGEENSSALLSEHLRNICRDSGIKIDFPELLNEQSSDAENAKRIYEALKNLSIINATDKRLWAYLTHVQYYEYLKNRWKIVSREEGDTKNNKDTIKDRYFLAGESSRALCRNAIARLWWGAHLTYDAENENPYEFTEMLFSNQNIQASLLERNFGRNKNLLKILLSYLKERTEVCKSDNIKILGKLINNLGGIRVLDTLDKNYIYTYLDKNFNISN